MKCSWWFWLCHICKKGKYKLINVQTDFLFLNSFGRDRINETWVSFRRRFLEHRRYGNRHVGRFDARKVWQRRVLDRIWGVSLICHQDKGYHAVQLFSAMFSYIHHATNFPFFSILFFVTALWSSLLMLSWSTKMYGPTISCLLVKILTQTLTCVCVFKHK